MPHYSNYGSTRLSRRVNVYKNQGQELTLKEKFADEDIFTHKNLNAKKSAKSASLELVNHFTSEDLTIPERINDAIVQGRDIDDLTGLGHNYKDLANDFVDIRNNMEEFINETSNGYIGGRHWSEFAESARGGWIGDLLGIGHEAYECTEEGVHNAHNHRERQINEQTGGEISIDINGDGKVGNGEKSGECDGETSILSKVANAIVDVIFGDDDDNNDENKKKSEADDNECFPKPWDDYYNFGTGFENYDQNSSELMNNFGTEFETNGQQNYLQDSMFTSTGNFF